MSEFFDSLSSDQADFIRRQPVFFVGSAAKGGRINVSPKGMDAFRVLGPNRVGYLDVGGSGNETQAHLMADGRVTIMFCAFDQPALILRLYGRGVAILPQDDEWATAAAMFTILPGARQIFLIDIDSVQTSCGWAVPIMTFDRERKTLSRHHAAQDPTERLAAISSRTRSIDGLPLRVQTSIPKSDVVVR
jgi:hypothetical protein